MSDMFKERISTNLSLTSHLILTGLIALGIWMLIPLTGFAANKAVTVDSTSAAASGVTVSGSTSATSVMVQVRDETGIIILDMYSMPVLDGKFSGTVSTSISAGQTVKVYVADYEGGTFTITSATVPASSPATDDSKTPSTPSSDSGNGGSSDSSGGDQGSSSDTGLTKKVMSVKMEYVVVRGDTMFKIARKLGTTVSFLAKWNPDIRNINLIFPGQRITYYVEKEVWVDGDGNVVDNKGTVQTNTERVYIVKRGDNLSKIARQLKTTVKNLLALNKDIKNPNLIYPNQKIYY
jgi:LysM repeat protein